MTKSDLWLIKSSGHILGPYSSADIVRLLRSKELVILDEVAQPCSRWMYIRDQKKFSSIVEEIRSGQFNADTTTDILKTNTITFTETSDSINDELTEEINISTIDEVVYENFKESGAGRRKNSTNFKDSFVFEGDKRVQQKSQETVRLLWLMTSAIIIAAMSFVLYKQFIKSPQSKKKITAEIIKRSIVDLELGDYPKSLSGFKEAYDLEPNNSSIFIYLGALLIHVEEQTVQGKRFLQKVLDLGEKYPKRAVTGLGLASLVDNELERADEYFDKALDMDPVYLPARINLGASALMSGQYPEANSHLHLAVKDGAQEGVAYVMLAESFIRLWERSGEMDHLQQAQNILKKYLKSEYDYRQEISFLLMYLRFLTGSIEDIEREIVDFLDTDPLQTNLHRHNIFIYEKRASWKVLMSWCENFVAKNQSADYRTALEAYCLIKSGDRLRANQKIESALNQNPKNPLIQAIYAYILDEIGLEEQASVAMGKAIEFDSRQEYKLPLLLQAQFCQDSGDRKCSQLYWQKLLQLDPRSLSGIAGVAYNYFKDESYAEAKKYVARGVRLSANYRPFLKIQMDLLEKGVSGSSEPQGL